MKPCVESEYAEQYQRESERSRAWDLRLDRGTLARKASAAVASGRCTVPPVGRNVVDVELLLLDSDKREVYLPVCKKAVDVEDVFPIKMRGLCGLTVPTPSCAARFLEIEYGKTWKTPMFNGKRVPREVAPFVTPNS